MFSSRETPAVLAAAIEALGTAAAKPMTVDVLVNGNPTLAEGVRPLLLDRRRPPEHVRTRIWHITLADKAHACNEYVHRLWPGAGTTFFVDGYVFVEPSALSRLSEWLAKKPEALAATGVPGSGRSAARLREILLQKGGLHGNLFAAPAATLDLLRRRGFRLPLGIYRTDSAIGAALAVAMEPVEWGWNARRFLPCNPAASWSTEPKRWWRWQDVRAQWRRKARQVQGELEIEAVRWWINTLKEMPERMPRTAAELVQAWAEAETDAFQSFLAGNWARQRAWAALQTPRDWQAATTPPQLVADSGVSAHGTSPHR